MRKKAIILGTCVILCVGALSAGLGRFQAGSEAGVAESSPDAYEYYYNTEAPEDADVKDAKGASTKKDKEKYIEVDTQPDSYTVLVNRDYPISKDYVPADLVVPDVAFSFVGTYEKSYVRERAARALEKLFAGASQSGYTLKAVSAYRSYARQMQIYNNNVRTRGKETTNKVSAKPGTSEHQTGLVIDVSSESVGCALEESFGQTPEGKWLKKNCYKYGFIIRYPKDKTEITGYSYEPWHIRYVGKNLAKYLKKNTLTLEEYYKLTTVDNKVKADTVEDTDTNIKNEPQMTAAPTPNATIVPTAKPTLRPSVTESPEVTKTAKPKKTAKPAKTAKPTKKPSAVKTPKPTKAPKPVRTPKPTKKPVVKPTAKPTEPPATKAPEPTQEPSADETTE